MSEGMHSWRNLAASGLSSVKGFLAQKDFKQIPGQIQQFAGSRSESGGWREWAGQRLGAIRNPNNASVSTERVALFPGWAARRYHDPARVPGQPRSSDEGELFSTF